VYQHGDNKVSGVRCQQFLNHQPCQAGQGISKKKLILNTLNAVNHKHTTEQKLSLLIGQF
jgi:hypothetical protein